MNGFPEIQETALAADSSIAILDLGWEDQCEILNEPNFDGEKDCNSDFENN